MKLKKITAVFLAVLLCICTMSAGVYAAKNDSIALNKDSASIAIGKSFTLKAAASDGSSVTWSTSDKTVATVSKKGVVTGKKIGTATITAKLKGTNKTASCTVKVVRGNKISADLTGQELLNKIKVGVNLGNTLSAWNNGGPGVKNELDIETYWSQPKATKKYFTAVKNAGFNAVRIPTTWTDHIDKDGNISKAWLDRVQEVVNYAYDQGMYVILNTHHDEEWLTLGSYDKKNAKKFENMWKQISARFKNYDERLIFESLNEPRVPGTEKEWWGGTEAERKVLNKYNKLFVDTVRAAGGNNVNRCLIIPSHGAKYMDYVLNDIEIPNNDKKVIVSVHAYEPWDFAANEDKNSGTKFTNDVKAEIDYVMNTINDCLVSKGVPVIMGEFGATDKNNTAERAKYAKYYISAARKIGVPCLWWESPNPDYSDTKNAGYGLIDRKTYEWYYSELVEALTGKKVK